MPEPRNEPAAAQGRLRAFGSRWLAERKRLYHEYERNNTVEAQADILLSELRRRRDGWPAEFHDLRELRAAVAEVDRGR